MIEEIDYKFPRDDSPREKTEDELRSEQETLEYLESLPWRPFGIDW